MSQEKDIILISRFFDFDLSDKELTSFEKRLLENAPFKEKVETYQKANIIVTKNHETEKDKLRLQKWNDLLDSKPSLKTRKTTSWKWVGSVAASVVLIFSVWQLNTGKQELDINKLINNSWSKEVGLDFNNTRDLTKDSLRDIVSKAFSTYKNNDFQSTLNLLTNFKATATYYEEVLLLRGLSHYKRGDTNKALKTLNQLYTYPTGKKAKVAQWYIGLIYLEQGDMEKAKELLILPDSKNNLSLELKE